MLRGLSALASEAYKHLLNNHRIERAMNSARLAELIEVAFNLFCIRLFILSSHLFKSTFRTFINRSSIDSMYAFDNFQSQRHFKGFPDLGDVIDLGQVPSDRPRETNLY
jgi:hypothetical protein